MKKFIFLLLINVSFLSAEINEYVSDVYFANGINTSSDDATQAIRRVKKKFMLAYPNSYKYIADWKVALNHTQGIGIDLYESMLQKIDEDWKIKYALKISGLLKYTYGGIVKKVASKTAKESIEEFTQKMASEIAKEIFVHYRPGDGTLDGYTQAAVELL